MSDEMTPLGPPPRFVDGLVCTECPKLIAALREARAEVERIKAQHWTEAVQRYAQRKDDAESPFNYYMVCSHDGEFVKRLDFLALQGELAESRKALGDRYDAMMELAKQNVGLVQVMGKVLTYLEGGMEMMARKEIEKVFTAIAATSPPQPPAPEKT